MDRTVRASLDGEGGDADAARLRMLLSVSLRDPGLEHRTLSTGNYVRTHRMDHAPTRRAAFSDIARSFTAALTTPTSHGMCSLVCPVSSDSWL
jgi:hypothetical protein